MTLRLGWFVTGTDTGVGKTFVAALIARRGVQLGHRVFAFKPIETGCEQAEGEDQSILCAAAGNWQHEDLRGSYQFRRPVAPLVAARAEARLISLDLIKSTFERGRQSAEWVVVEGAGGWRVPITAVADMSNLARLLGLPVLLVARASLGTINHTLLSVEAIQRDGCPLTGVVLSEHSTDDAELTASNVEEIQRRTKVPVWRWTGQPSDPDVLNVAS